MADPHAELDLAQRYAAGTLSAAEAAAFEDHMVGCERCATEVRLTAGLRRVMRETPVALPASTARRVRWIAGAAMLLAASIATFMLMPGRRDTELRALGSFAEPPAFVGMSVRALPQHADSLFADAMAAYVARRYDAAAGGLRDALTAGVDSIPATFFMASAELMAGNPRVAEVAYARVIVAGEAAAGYLPEAHLFRARALLQLGRGAEALTDLAAVDRDSDRGAAAAALADSVARVIKR